MVLRYTTLVPPLGLCTGPVREASLSAACKESVRRPIGEREEGRNIHRVPRFGDDGFRGLLRKCSKG